MKYFTNFKGFIKEVKKLTYGYKMMPIVENTHGIIRFINKRDGDIYSLDTVINGSIGIYNNRSNSYSAIYTGSYDIVYVYKVLLNMQLNPMKLVPGTIVQHFKREFVTNKNSKQYLYEIVGVARNSEDWNECAVVYKSLYSKDCGDKGRIKKGDIFIRPYYMFMSKVDHDKYPDIKQEFRFEKVKSL